VLEQALEQAMAGDGQVVGVVAEAGVGKSRLCLEFVERCRARGISVNEGHCPSHGKTVSYLPLLELLRGIFGIGERDGDFEARRKIAAELLVLDASLDALLPLVCDFLGVRDPERPALQLPPNARQQQLVAFVRQLVKARSAREPRVLLIDDAHWIDAGSDALLAQLVEAVPGTRTLVVVNFRPEYHAAWMGRASYRQLPLLPLGSKATEELLGDLVGRAASLAGLAERIHEHTRGTPFFVEEVVRSLVESGRLVGSRGTYRLVAPLEAIEIPSTVQAVLAARIDRLPEREKRLLQSASVIGRQVPANVLERVAELSETELPAALATLVQAEFLFEKALYPEAEYAFKHPLTHEVAYRSQLAERRARTHAAVAEAVEEVDAERLDEQAALLAYHRERAGELLLAARWNTRAARHRVATDQLGAIEHWRTARSLLAKAGESDEQLELEACRGLLGYAAWYGAAEDEIAASFARGRALAEGRGDERSLCHLHLHYAIWHGMVRSDSATCARHAQVAADLAERVGDEGAALAAASGLVLVRYLEGRVSDAISLGRRALPREPDDPMLGSEYWSVPPVVWLKALTHHLEGWAGRPRESLASLEGLIPLARSQGVEGNEGILRMWIVHQAEVLGDAAAAMTHARRVEIGRGPGKGGPFAAPHYCLGIAHLLGGNSREAASCFERALVIYQEGGGGPPAEMLTSSGRLAVAYADLGQPERARETSARGLALLRALQMPVYLTIAVIFHAQVLRKTQGAGAREAIEAALAEAGALVESTGIRAWQPFLHAERAELARLRGDEATRVRELRDAHQLFAEMGAEGHAERVERELSR
jgi:adenylate cyclase